MRIVQWIAVATIFAAIGHQHANAQNLTSSPSTQAVEQETKKGSGPTTKEILTDAAVIALIIAASIAAYKAMGKPCACPEDMTSNGRRCGKNSAWYREGGYRPLCRLDDVTPEMISAYRTRKVVPGLK